MKYALILDTSFIRGRLWREGEIVHAYDGPFGRAIQPCDENGVLLTKVKASVKLGAYGVQHAGAGRWVVTDPQGEKCSEVFQRDPNDPAKAKADAQAEADRLNAGGDAVQVPDEAVEETEQAELPDA